MSLICAKTLVAVSGDTSRPLSLAAATIFPRPLSSLTTALCLLPTNPGTTWLYDDGILASAATCSPPLCANALLPTYACFGSSGCPHALATALATRVIFVKHAPPSSCPGKHFFFIFSCKFPATTSKSAFPVRSPYPLTHPCTIRAPPLTPAKEFATASEVSLCACVPTLHFLSSPSAERACTTAAVPASQTQGMLPPFVSQSTT
mmetsp:Transcript_4965/g.16548  ORF Transcript_4965/g.16548 Transcript_4965/m.16548 type:complete len:205 (+) Transcript_4965:732-1346(+)